jgi:hypothetical protein
MVESPKRRQKGRVDQSPRGRRRARAPQPHQTPTERQLLRIQVKGWLAVAATVQELLPQAATAAKKGKLALLRIAARFFRLPHIDAGKLPQPITETTHHIPRPMRFVAQKNPLTPSPTTPADPGIHAPSATRPTAAHARTPTQHKLSAAETEHLKRQGIEP